MVNKKLAALAVYILTHLPPPTHLASPLPDNPFAIFGYNTLTVYTKNYMGGSGI